MMKKIILAAALLLCMSVSPFVFAKTTTPTTKTTAKVHKLTTSSSNQEKSTRLHPTTTASPSKKTTLASTHKTNLPEGIQVIGKAFTQASNRAYSKYVSKGINEQHNPGLKNSPSLGTTLDMRTNLKGEKSKTILLKNEAIEKTSLPSQSPKRITNEPLVHSANLRASPSTRLNSTTTSHSASKKYVRQTTEDTDVDENEVDSKSTPTAPSETETQRMNFHYGPNIATPQAIQARTANTNSTPVATTQIVPAPQVSQQIATTAAIQPQQTNNTQDTDSNWFSKLFRSSQPDADETSVRNSWFGNFQSRAAQFAHNTVSNMRYSSYKFGGTHFDPQNGIYMLDCSDYVDNLLHRSSPQAYTNLAQWTGSYKPNSEHYYNFFNRLAMMGGHTGFWSSVSSPQTLQPGDVLVFRYKHGRGRLAGGHVMLVMNKAIVNPSVVEVQVADSASAGHSADTRAPRTSGIGIGTLLLKVNPATGRPYAYAWKINSPWNSDVNIAMGHPVNA